MSVTTIPCVSHDFPCYNISPSLFNFPFRTHSYLILTKAEGKFLVDQRCCQGRSSQPKVSCRLCINFFALMQSNSLLMLKMTSLDTGTGLKDGRAMILGTWCGNPPPIQVKIY
jgi:hypothetical protein